MNEQEGVIKYQLDHQIHEIDFDVTELISWRTLLYKLELINQRTDKYGGLSYGNISYRLTPEADQFVISASQTAYSAHTTRQDYVLITEYNIKQNSMKSIGVKQPSSEALTHAAIYQSNSAVQAVIHVHSPLIWTQSHQLKLPCIDAHIDYGSVAMAEAVSALAADYPDGTVFSMLGHEDGVVVCGHTLSSSCHLLIEILVKAIKLDQQNLKTGH